MMNNQEIFTLSLLAIPCLLVVALIYIHKLLITVRDLKKVYQQSKENRKEEMAIFMQKLEEKNKQTSLEKSSK